VLRCFSLRLLSRTNGTKLGGEAVFPAAGYLSVAIEALRQVHDTENRPFHGVRLRDIDIKTALVVPEADGIEIVTCLHTTTDEEYTFTLESVVLGEWTLHCEGKISAAPDSTITREHPVDEGELTQRVTGKRWYDTFHRVGFNYNNTFQRLLDAKTDKSVHHAVGDVVLSQSSGIMVGESRYMIHPSTIDAVLQLVIVSVHAGKHKEMQWGIVPTHIGQFSLAFPEGEGEAESTGHAVGWMENSDGRHFYTHACLNDSTGKLVMDIDGLACVAYEAVLPPEVQAPSDPEPFSIMTWKPDIETLPSDSPVSLESITDLVELICHKKTVKSALICGAPSSATIKAALKDLPAGCSFTVGFSEEKRADSVDEELRGRVTVKTSAEEWQVGVDGARYDLLIVDSSQDKDASLSLEVDTLIPLINTGGWLVGAKSCLTLLPATAVTYNQSFVYKLTDTVSDTNNTTLDISLLSPESPFSEATSLGNVLIEKGRNVCEKRLAGFTADSEQCIVIDDRKGTTLLSLTEAEFTGLKAVLASGSLLLWLTQGVQEGSSAEGGMAEGFLRVIRSEQAAVRVALLDVDQSESTNAIAQTILNRLDTMASSSSDSDTEFWLHQGVLRISRLYPHDPLSEESEVVEQEEEKRPVTPTTGLLPAAEFIKAGGKDTHKPSIHTSGWLPLTPPDSLPSSPSARTKSVEHTHTETHPIKTPTVDATPKATPKMPQLSLSSEGTYVLVGCLGGLGRSLTKWMVEQGARHFAFISRSGASKPEAARVIENIGKCPGTSTRVYRADASDVVAMQCIIYSLQAERPVRGVIHAAMVLRVCKNFPYLTHLLTLTP